MDDLSAYVLPGLVTLALSGASLAGSRWWYQRKLGEITKRLERLEAIRMMADQHAQQARRQVEQLQQQLASQHGSQPASQTRSREDAQQAARTRAQLERTLAENDARAAQSARPVLPANGFADTLPMCVRRSSDSATPPLTADAAHR